MTFIWTIRVELESDQLKKYPNPHNMLALQVAAATLQQCRHHLAFPDLEVFRKSRKCLADRSLTRVVANRLGWLWTSWIILIVEPLIAPDQGSAPHRFWTSLCSLLVCWLVTLARVSFCRVTSPADPHYFRKGVFRSVGRLWGITSTTRLKLLCSSAQDINQ